MECSTYGGPKKIVQNHAGIPGDEGLPMPGRPYVDEQNQRFFSMSNEI